ncbi:MAG: hypothetical protein ABIS17_12070 [Casimicrobiaceae bacterium]
MMAERGQTEGDARGFERLTHELEEAEIFVQRMSRAIAAIRDELMDGNVSRALSMCNQALTEIDSATDVVAPSPRSKEEAELDADDATRADGRA